jgi:TRAP-type mannitol/chloroaromatic compound transport system permease small subunit
MHFFGTLGTLMFFIGFVFIVLLGLSKMWAVYNLQDARLLTQRPSFYISLTCMIMGTLLFLAGFLGELISRMGVHRNQYQIEKTL